MTPPLPISQLALLPVTAVMTAPVVGVKPDQTVLTARGLMRDHDINHLPVLSPEGRTLGIISMSDIRRLTHWRAFFQPDRHADDIDRLLGTLLVEEVMSRRPAVVARHCDVSAAARIINERRFHCLPVVDEEGCVCGIITAHDLLRLAFPE